MQPISNCFLIKRSKHINKQKRKNDNILVCYRWEKIFSRQPHFKFLPTYNLGDFWKVKYSKSLLNKMQLFKRRIILSHPHEKFLSIDLASVVQKVDNAINCRPVASIKWLGGLSEWATLTPPLPRLKHTSWYMSDHYICLQYLPGCFLIQIVFSTTPAIKLFLAYFRLVWISFSAALANTL